MDGHGKGTAVMVGARARVPHITLQHLRSDVGITMTGSMTNPSIRVPASTVVDIRGRLIPVGASGTRRRRTLPSV